MRSFDLENFESPRELSEMEIIELLGILYEGGYLDDELG